MKELESLDAAFVIDTFLLLLIGIGPKIALVPFLDATAGMPEAVKRRVLRKMLTTAAIVAALLLVLGGLLTRLLHFSPGALGIASGETGGAALGLLASCPRRSAYPNASFTLSEPKLQFGGTVTAVTAREQQARRMVDSLFYRIAEATGRDAGEIREDARRGRTFTAAEAIGYGLVQDRAAKRPA